MGHKLLITLLIVTACHVGVLLAADCEPSCVDTASTLIGERKCLPPTTMVADPLNCTQYYFCLADCETTQVPLPCDSGAFDPVAGACGGPTPCTPSCQPNTCHLTCNGTGDVIGDPNDCGIYYICYPHGPEGPFTCGADAPFFNGETCVVEEGECCQQQCTPFCDAVGTQVADPTDCHKYYICIATGIPDESVHFTCNGNEVFDVSLGRCVAGATCQVLCAGGSSSPSASTTPSSASASTTSAVTTTAAVTPTSECLDSLTCTAAGNFAKCLTCQPDYFYCSAGGAQGETRQCSGNLVFNPNPGFPYCVQPSNCPYSP